MVRSRPVAILSRPKKLFLLKEVFIFAAVLIFADFKPVLTKGF